MDFGNFGNLDVVKQAKGIFDSGAETGQRLGNAAGLLGTVASLKPPEPEGVTRVKNSQGGQTLKKVASAVAAYYTGGLSALGTNLGSSIVSQNNPQAGALIGMAGSMFGGGGK